MPPSWGWSGRPAGSCIIVSQELDPGVVGERIFPQMIQRVTLLVIPTKDIDRINFFSVVVVVVNVVVITFCQ